MMCTMEQSEPLYLRDSYVKGIDTNIAGVEGSSHLALEDELFYPEGGGQPGDTGTLSWDGGSKSARITGGRKAKGRGVYTFQGDIPNVGDTVHAVLDWDRRYGFMKMHTAQHLVCGVIAEVCGSARNVLGNQIGKEHSRMDMDVERLEQEDLEKVEERANEKIAEELGVKICHMDRAEAEKFLEPWGYRLDMLPSSVKIVRVVEIDGYDASACGGTHVKNIKELGKVKMLKRENKGKNCRRIYYTLE
jgi:misacylated tRNA(Ala) deacylase